MTLMLVAKTVGSLAVGGFVGWKAGGVLSAGINQIKSHTRAIAEKKEAEKMYYLTKTIKIESLV